jgi:hypothetical protein
MKCLAVQDLIAAAATPAAALPDETHQSFPIPIHVPAGYRVAFMFCRSNVTMKIGLRLMPPSYVAELDAVTGKPIRMWHVSPSDFGRADPEHQFLGRYDMLPDGRTPEQYHELRAKLLVVYDVLIPVFGDRPTQVPSEIREAAADFLVLFPQVIEQPLQPYYQVLGREFFAWLEQVSR